MPLFRVTVKRMKNTNGIRLEPGMTVDIPCLSLKPWGIALKFLFLHHENILFPND